MADVKDILGVPRGPATPLDKFATPEAPKQQKEKVERPKGMSREAFALLGGSHPIAPSQLASELKNNTDLKGLKKKRKPSQKGTVTWQWRGFINQARKDGLQLKHWVKCYKDGLGRIQEAAEGDYPFVKYNKQPLVYQYNDEEWANLIAKDPAWSREETDYLLDLCRQFDLRFLLIADRYEFEGGAARTVETLKARYYAIARQLFVGREGSEENVANHILVKHPFNPAHERERKRGLELVLTRTGKQEAEENALLEQAAVIEAQRRAEAAARRGPDPSPSGAPGLAPDFVAPSEFQNVPEEGVAQLFGPDLAPLRPQKPGVTARGVHLREQGQAQLARVSGGARQQKLVETTLAEVGVAGAPAMPTRAVAGAWLALRLETIAMLEARRKLQNLQANAGGLDEAGRSKRGKGKAPSRYEDGVPGTPRSDKRPRTAKKFADDE